MSYLIDTGIAIDLRDRRDPILSTLEQLPTLPFLSVLSLVELEGGIHSRPDLVATRREGLARVLGLLEVIELSIAVAKAYGGIVERHGFNRRRIIDRMIAATAIEHDLTLITGNGSDFVEIDGLKLMVWPS